MHQRLLFILSLLFISGVSMAQNVMTPSDGDHVYNAAKPAGDSLNPIPSPIADVMQKWVHDPNQPGKIGRIPWDQTLFKAYRWNSLSFRLRFPNNYDPTQKYPLIVFLHGAGEACPSVNTDNTITVNRENQDQLFWGAKLFSDRINNGEWNGFLLFPQRIVDAGNLGAQWDDNTIPPINNILDTLTKYNGLDPDRVIAMGLSAGGLGTFNYANLFPKRIATVVCAGPEHVADVLSTIENYVQIPFWVTAGGIDNNPDPTTVLNARDQIVTHGANFYLGYYPTSPHDTWEVEWAQTDAYKKLILDKYWNAAHKAQPLVYFQNNVYCAGAPISTKLGLTAGFAAYEWQYDNGSGFTTIPGATANTYTATQVGRYQAHFKRNIDSAWSAWSPNPVVISTKACTLDTAFAEHFDETPINPYITFAGDGSFNNSPYYNRNTACQNGIFTSATEVFSQDAKGQFGGHFMLNNTTAVSGCNYFAGDQVWRTYNNVPVTANTNYTFSFYMGNQGVLYYSPGTNPLTKLSAKINGVTLAPITAQAVLVGDPSWKKYSFVWNSGSNTSAQLAITNNTTDGSGNDFVLDEISLVKYKAPALPGAAFQNLTLWAKANSLPGADGSPVGLWTNSDINGNNLQQPFPGALPILKNNAADNINFNPIVNFNAASGQFMQASLGFSGNTTHTAVSAYIVAKFNSLTQNKKNVLIESQAASTAVAVTLRANGSLDWTAGANTVSTPANAIDAGKPIVWTFSKDDNTTASGGGDKQDIRKNGIVVNASTSTGSFTGNNSPFQIANGGQFFNGDIAEIVYVLDSNITPLTQNRIESYLALKYGTTQGNITTPINYTASDSITVFWPASTIYQNDVFGIGTDSLSGLVQVKSNSVNSGSGNGTGQFAKGNLVLATNTSLPDKSFLVIGNDAGSLSQHVIAPNEASAVAVGSTRIIRNWKAVNTGAVGAVDLSFDTTGLGPQAGANAVSNYAVMIDNDGDGDYNTGILSFFTASGASGNKLNFSGLTLPNGAVFTVITNKFQSALPAVWLGFTATAVNGNALLNWKTSDEINVDRYTVEHSFNGVSFAAVGSVIANNNTGVNQYSFTHEGLAPGIHYYRIRRTDKDGKSGYSDIKSIKISTTGANVQVRPNPVVGSTLVLAVSVQQSNKTNIQVMGVDGKVIVHQNINLAAGNNLININIASVPPGIYLVQVQLADEVVTKKFIKER